MCPLFTLCYTMSMLKTRTQFINAYVGTKILYPPTFGQAQFDAVVAQRKFGAQCKDEAQRYIMEVLGYPALPLGNAIDMPNVYQKNLYTWFPYVQGNVIQPGDIGIWGSQIGVDGHIDFATDAPADAQFWQGCDQNWPLDNGVALIHHSYAGMLGWLRPKSSYPVHSDDHINIPLMFQQIWHTPGAPGDIAYFQRRLDRGSVKDVPTMTALMEKWYAIVYPLNNKTKQHQFSVFGNIQWQIQKKL